MSSFSIVIPAKNEAGAIAKVVAGAREHYPDAEIIVVDDGSGDDTAKVAEEAGERCVGLFAAFDGLAHRAGVTGRCSTGGGHVTGSPSWEAKISR